MLGFPLGWVSFFFEKASVRGQLLTCGNVFQGVAMAGADPCAFIFKKLTVKGSLVGSWFPPSVEFSFPSTDATAIISHRKLC